MADVGCLSVKSTALTVGNGCITFISTAIPFLRTYYFDFGENVEEFRNRKREVECKKADYEMVLLLARRNKMIAKNDVDNWYSDCKVKIKECDRLVIDLGRNSGREWWSCQTFKLSIQLLKMTKQMTELIDRYNKFQGSMFIEDLNRKIVDDFQYTKHKFEALTAFRSLEELSDQSDGIEKWSQEYEEMKRQCDDIENKLKNYNTEEGESFGVCIEDVKKKTTEMTELIDRYNLIYSFQNIKKEFDAMIESYGRERKFSEKDEKDGKIPTELVKVWMDDCEKLQKKYGGGNTVIQAEGESSHRQEQLIWQMEEMKNLTTRYNKFQGSMFIKDLNRQILDNFEATKSKFEALTAFRSLEQVSDQSDGIEKWRREYEKIKRQCDVIESGNLGMEDLQKMTTEMTVLIDQYNQFFSFQNKKNEFDAMIQDYRRERKSAEKDGKIPTELVKLWMEECEKLQKNYGDGNTEIQAEGEFSHRWEMEEMQNLITRFRWFNGFSNMFVQPLETVKKRMTEYKPLNSMEKNKKKIYAAIKDEMVIRLFGMGGVGKTTLMQQINDEMSDKTDFKLIIWVTVSTTFTDIKSIQDQISHRLELKGNDSEDISVRAKNISEYLIKQVDGNVLFIFDDVWEMLDLNAIGIPDRTYGDDGRKCCKIVLTTRDRSVQVIHPMRPKDIEVKGLDENESWILFKINAGIEDNIDNGIKKLAENICRKCKGLPLAITVIAKMLHREEEKAIWSETLTFLNKKDASRYIPNLSYDVYIPLKLSYDRLKREDLKIGFLLCSLFPEDYEIEVRDLFCYGIGAGEIAKGCQSFDACRDIFIDLKNEGLLQDGVSGDDSARMHEVVYDAAHFIAKKEFGGFFCNAELTKWISSVQNSSLEMENVLSLDLRTQTSTSLQADTTKSFIKKLKELRVLIFQGEDKDEEIPVNIKEYFILHNLSVLCLRNVYIEELDTDFSIKLCNLRVIDFSDTMINVIRPKVFSNLHNKLEVLHMTLSFNKWQASDEKDGEYVRFAELAELKKLYSLQVDIKDGEIFSHQYRPELVLSSVEYFSINLYVVGGGNWNSKQLTLSNIQVWNGAKWIKDMLRKTDTLRIFEENDEKDDREFSVPLTQDIINSMCNLETLELYDFPSCKHVIQCSSNEGHHCTSKPILHKAKVLRITRFSEMENIFVRTLTPTVIPKGSFGKLQDISIWDCPKLKFIFPWNVATCLVQLKTLSIKSCDELEVIVEKEDNGDYNNQGERELFPELTEMTLSELPKLEYVLSRSDKTLKNLKQQFLLGESSAPNLKLVNWDGKKFVDE